MRSNVYYDHRKLRLRCTATFGICLPRKVEKKEKRKNTEACQNKPEQHKWKSASHWKLCSQILFIRQQKKDEYSRRKWLKKKNKFVYYVVGCCVREDETRVGNRTKKEMTIQINSPNKIFTWLQSFIYLSKICTRIEPEAATEAYMCMWSSVRVWHWMEHTSGNRWNNKTWAQAAELRHNLLWCIQCSLYIFIPVAVVSSLISHEISARNTERSVCSNHVFGIRVRSITPSPVTHYLHIKLCTKIMWKHFLNARV